MSRVGVIINRKEQIERFINMIGFSDGIKVVRKGPRNAVWYSHEKAGLQKLFLRISSEQNKARALGLRGAFANCATREQTLERLKNWYAELNGGGKT